MTAPGSYQTETADMIAVHQALTGALDAAPSLVSGAGGSADRVEVIASYYENVLEFLHVHHAGEDELIYPVLKERCGADKEMLERIDDQHDLLNEPMDDARDALTYWRADPSADAGEAVVQRLGVVGETLRPHLDEEESMVLPIASAWLSPDEWGQLPGHALRSFGGDKPWLALGLIRERLPQDKRDQMLSGMPPPLQTLWTEQWEPAFTAFITEVRS